MSEPLRAARAGVTLLVALTATVAALAQSQPLVSSWKPDIRIPLFTLLVHARAGATTGPRPGSDLPGLGLLISTVLTPGEAML